MLATHVCSFVSRCQSLEMAHWYQENQDHHNVMPIKGTRRSRTAARSESSTSPNTHRPAIEPSSSSTLLAWSMMVHIDVDLVAMRTCRAAIDWLQSHALVGLPRRRWDLDARRMQLQMASRRHNVKTSCDGHREWMIAADGWANRRRWFGLGYRCTILEDCGAGLVESLWSRTRTRTSHRSTTILALGRWRYQQRWFDVDHHRSRCLMGERARQAVILSRRRQRTRARDRSTTRTPIDGCWNRRRWCDDDACRSQCLGERRTRGPPIHAGRCTTRTIARSETTIVLDDCDNQWRGCDHDRDRSRYHTGSRTGLAGRLPGRRTWTRTRSRHRTRILALDDCCTQLWARDLDDGRMPSWLARRIRHQHRRLSWYQSRAWSEYRHQADRTPSSNSLTVMIPIKQSICGMAFAIQHDQTTKQQRTAPAQCTSLPRGSFYLFDATYNLRTRTTTTVTLWAAHQSMRLARECVGPSVLVSLYDGPPRQDGA